MITGMEPLHISEADAVRDLAAILQRVQAGAEVVIERDAQPLAIIRAAALRNLPTTSGNDNEPSSVPRAASRISFLSRPRIKSFPCEMKKNQTVAVGKDL